jgi:hypothetical protein
MTNFVYVLGIKRLGVVSVLSGVCRGKVRVILECV